MHRLQKEVIVIDLSQFFYAILQDRLIFLAILFFFGILFINGWSDAPCAVSGVIMTNSLREKTALRLAGICNFLGVLAGGMLFSSLSDTMYAFTAIQNDPAKTPLLLCICGASVILFAVFAQGFGIPTSESHALLGALCGIQFAHCDIASLSFGMAFGKVLYGLFVSVLIGGLFSALLVLLLQKPLRTLSEIFHRRAEILFAALHAFLHGLQDGQKLITLILLCAFTNQNSNMPNKIPLLLLLFGGVVLAIGTRLCSKRIIETMGKEMVTLDHAQTFLSEVASLSSIFVVSLFGIPVSTTQLKGSSMLGSAFGGGQKWQKNTVISLFSVWITTFPICFLIGFFATKLLCR